MTVAVVCADARALPLPDASVDAVVTDPPYGLEFMGREWDTFRTGDGFRRSRNMADAGRDSVFGRTSRTSPEYVTGRLGKQPKVGDADETPFRRNTGTPSWSASGNPRCLNCGGTKYDQSRPNGCRCPEPRFPVESAVQMNAYQAWCEEWARECLRVLKPGGWMLCFGGTRTWHRLACGIEDAGFEIRDTILDLTGQHAPGLAWVYGQGMPKNLDAGRAVDMYVCTLPGRHFMRQVPGKPKPEDHVCLESEQGHRWRGWGTSDKPAWEPIIVARKALAGTLGRNLVEHGVGALNIDGCRIRTTGSEAKPYTVKRMKPGATLQKTGGNWRPESSEALPWEPGREYQGSTGDGRWPTNVLLIHAPGCRQIGIQRIGGDARAGQERGQRPGGFGNIGADRGSPLPNGQLHGEQAIPVFDCAPGCPVAEMDRQSGVSVSRDGGRSTKVLGVMNDDAWQPRDLPRTGHADTGGASRFFPVFKYEAKAGSQERPRLHDGTAWPTVKPVALIQWLIRLVTPAGGVVLDCFAGTGTAGEACIVEGVDVILLDNDPQAVALTRTRLAKPIQPTLGLEITSPPQVPPSDSAQGLREVSP